MSSYIFVVLIVAIGCATGVITTYFKTRAAREQQGTNLDETIAQLNALEERIKVIERIVTEKRFDLKREIDNL